MTAAFIFAALALTANLAAGQIGAALPEPQLTSWNSTFKLSPEQLQLGNLTEEFGTLIEYIINFDRSQLANGGPREDDFYNVPSNITVPTKPGKAIKVQEVTDPAPWSIPSKTALSRFIYSTTDINGTLIPASAYVLWPYQPKKFRGDKKKCSSAPVVLWTHGTSGFYPSGAPSTHRALFYADFVPFALAQAGYVVVAPDYAGLGVGTSWDGTRIPHQYLAKEAGAGDALNALRAAWETFPGRLSKDYVAMGHSQGGVVGWSLSEILARNDSGFEDVAKHHLGTVLAAPPTNFSLVSRSPQIFLPWIGKDLDQIYPEFNLSDWLTPLGVARTKLLNQVEGSQMVTTYMFQPQEAIVQPDWAETWAAEWFAQLSNVGGRPFKGPMLVLQGTEDPAVVYNVTLNTVEETCKTQKGDLEFLAVPGAGHFPVIDAARQTWLDWIEDRFEGLDVAKQGCGVRSELESFLPVENYQVIPNSFPQWAGDAKWTYELPTKA